MSASTPIRLRSRLADCREAGDAYHDAEAGGWWLFLPSDTDATFWPYRERLQNGSLWTWDGDEERPTLSPSLHLQIGGTAEVPRRTLWHGWLRAGRLVGV